MDTPTGEILIGTSGWNYPTGRGTWNGIFYPARRPRKFDELTYYAERFDTVEVNSTFYRMPERDLSENWLGRTPPSFQFAIKLYQKFTHPDMYLARDGVRDWDLSREDVDLFREGVDPIAEAGRLAAVLIQFPESFHEDSDARMYVEWLLDAFRDYPLAIELRHKSWDASDPELAALVTDRGATRVVADEPFSEKDVGCNFRDFRKLHPTSFLYLRLHGRNRATWWQHEKSEDRYNYLYTPEELDPIADMVREAAAERRRVLLYMNNHFSAKSVANAVILKRQLGQPIPGEYPPALVETYPDLEGLVTTSAPAAPEPRKRALPL